MGAVEGSPAIAPGDAETLPRTLGAAEIGAFGSAAVFFGLLAGAAAGLRPLPPLAAALVILAAAAAGAVFLSQLRALSLRWPEVSGGTPSLVARLLGASGLAARYSAALSFAGWAALPPLSAAISASLVHAFGLEHGIDVPILPLRISLTVVAFAVAFAGTRNSSVAQVLVAAPAAIVAAGWAGVGFVASPTDAAATLPLRPDATPGAVAAAAFCAFAAVLALEGVGVFAAEARNPSHGTRGLVVAGLMGAPLLALLALVLGGPTLEGSPLGLHAAMVAVAAPWLGKASSPLATYLIACGTLLAGATGVAAAARVALQSARDGRLAPVFTVVSPHGVPASALTLAAVAAAAFLFVGEPLRLLLVVGCARLAVVAIFHFALWARRADADLPAPRAALVLGVAECALLAAAAWVFGVAEVGAVLLLPLALFAVDAGVRRVSWAPFRAEDWRRFHRRVRPEQPPDVLFPHVVTILVIACGAAAAGWLFGMFPGPRAVDLLAALLVGAGYVAVAAASWTSLAQLRRSERWRADAERAREALQVEAGERRQAEDQRERSEAVLRAILNSMGDGVIVADRDGKHLFSNPAAERILGVSLREPRAEHWSETFGAFLHDGVTPLRSRDLPIHRALRGEITDGVEMFLRNAALPKGAYLRCTGRPLVDESGERQGGVVVFSDVTELRHAEDRLIQQVHLLDLAHDAIIVRDLEGRIQFWNRGAELLYGWTKHEAMHGVAHDLLRARYPQSLDSLHAELFRTGYWEGELSHARRDGERLAIEGRWAVRRDARGNPAAILEINRDVSARKQAERELAQAKEAAEAANRAKSEFVANMSHELRTPMNGVLGMIELMLREEVPPRQREFLTLARSSARALLRVVDDVLDFSKIEARKLEVEAIPFRLRDSVGATLRALGVQASQKRLALSSRFAPELPEGVVGDPVRLGQVLNNLVGNAIKFTTSGRIVVEVEMELLEEDAVTALFSVHDTGPGIPQAKHRLIFEAFSQGDSTTTRQYGGTGLGLTISRQLVGLMGGRIEVESRPGEGSTFRFSVRFGLAAGPLPARRPDEAAVGASPSGATTPARTLRVLLAEDNEVNQVLVRHLLESRGHRVEIADNGRWALERLERVRFDLALVDVAMPEMDGLRLAHEVRERERHTGEHLLMVAMTAHAKAGDRERCLAAGMDDYLPKPIDLDRFLLLVDGWAERGPAETGGSEPGVGEPVPAPAPAGLPEFDADEALKRARGKKTLLREMAHLFSNDAPVLLADLRTASAGGDFATVERVAHRLTGSLGTLCAPAALEAARTLEAAAVRKDTAAVAFASVRLDELVLRLIAVLQSLPTEEDP